MPQVIVRPATREDIATFSTLADKPTAKAWCMEIEGRIVALGGIARFNGRWAGFCDLTSEARPYKMHIARTAKRILDQARRDGIKFVYADADPNEPGAVHWLTRLGFTLIEQPGRPTFYRWSAS